MEPDGLPATHHIEQIVEALADGVDHISHLLDDNTLMVDVRRGGAVPGPIYQMRSRDRNNYRVLDLRLDRTLRRGETAILNYTTTFSYSEQPAAEVRRMFRRKVDRFLLRVRFHPDMMPTAVWWAEWGGITDGQIMRREKMTLNQSFEAHRFLEGGVEHAVVGFYWEW